MDPFWIALLAVLALAAVTPFSIRRSSVRYWRERRWRDELGWPSAAQTLGLEERRPGARDVIGRVSGLVEGVPVEIVVGITPFGFGLRHELSATLARDPGFTAHRRPRDSDAGVPSGDPCLDAAIRFETAGARHLRLACDAPTRAALHETVGQGAVLMHGRLTRQLHGQPTAEALVRIVRALARGARVLDRPWQPRARLLTAVRDDPEWRLRLASLRTLLHDRDPDLDRVLHDARVDAAPAVRLVASLAGDDGLDELRLLRSSRALVDLLQRPEPELRIAAAEAYARTGSLQDVELLLDVARRPKNSSRTRDAIQGAVDAIRSRRPGEEGRLALEAPQTGTLSFATSA
jgi:hypothetical protein